MNQKGWQPPQQPYDLKSDSWAVKANNQKFLLGVPDRQMKHLNVTERTAFKDETEELSKLSASGKGNKCLFLVELKTEDQEGVEPITQAPRTETLVNVARC